MARFSEQLLIAAAAALLTAVIVAVVAAFGGGESSGAELRLVEGDPLNVAEYHFAGPYPLLGDHLARLILDLGGRRAPA